ncbi:MAG: 4-hydroxybenzoate octaprenyltransferase [Pseudomonadota bacterium]
MHILKFKLKDYLHLARLHRPVGIYLLFLPCLWGVLAGYLTLGHIIWGNLFFYSILFFIGSALMRSAGCVINDYFDRDFDKSVARTKDRPIATGRISPKQALYFFAFLCLLSSLILFFLPPIAVLISLFSVIPVVTYPLMKRITYWPQIFLGLIFNIGIIIGYVTITQNFETSILWLYAAGLCHTVGYDTIYAFQDIEDDMKIGVKSSAQRISAYPKLAVSFFYGLVCMCFGIFLYAKNISPIFTSILIIQLCWHIYKWVPESKQSSLTYFKNANHTNIVIVMIFVAAMITMY